MEGREMLRICWGLRALLFVALLVLQGCHREAGPLGLALVADGFERPLFAASPPGDVGRLFVVEQTGRIWIVAGGERLGVPFLDVSGRLGASSGEQGLLGLAFHPEFSSNGFFYVNYTNAGRNTRVSRFVAAGDVADAESESILLEVEQPFSNHNGGMLAFGPDGFLYVAMGDGGSGNDPENNGQRLDTLLGKLLRIDVDGGPPYGIPADNPFLEDSAARGEIWAYGLRNPWRFSFDRVTGDLYIGDVGQRAREEINFAAFDSAGGVNFGWRNREGSVCRPGETVCSVPGAVEPIFDYDKLVSQSVTGGYVYRGGAIGGLGGTYFFADYVSGEVWSFRFDGVTLSEFQVHPGLTPPGTNVSSFGEDGLGELYVVGYRGGVYRIVEVAGDGGL